MTPKLDRIARPEEYWMHVARSCTARHTEEQLKAIVALCMKTDAEGRPCGVWHAAAVVAGQEARCCCAPCRKARGEKPVCL